MSLGIQNYSYSLPPKLIANEPCDPRDQCRLLVLNRDTGALQHRVFHELSELLTPNDVLVLNQSKVFPARILGIKFTGGKVEVLLLEQINPTTWKCITHPGLKPGTQIMFSADLRATVVESDKTTGIHQLVFDQSGSTFFATLDQIGHTPIPPYIHPTKPEQELRNRYQTVYAKEVGSAAAPTAGLHFTEKLLNQLKDKGVGVEYVTLHVGLGTFQPLREENIESKTLHSEHYEITEETAKRLNEAKNKGKRIIAVGTTSMRTLESAVKNGKIIPGSTATNIFIFPPYRFQFVDSLITNFHLPESSLLMLVSAFMTKPNTLERFFDFNHCALGRAYQTAIDNHYHFFSFGDAMWIR